MLPGSLQSLLHGADGSPLPRLQDLFLAVSTSLGNAGRRSYTGFRCVTPFSPFAPCSTSQMQGPPLPMARTSEWGLVSTFPFHSHVSPQYASLTCMPLQASRGPRSHLDQAKSTVSVSALITCSPRSPPTPPTTLGTTYPTSRDPLSSKQGL